MTHQAIDTATRVDVLALLDSKLETLWPHTPQFKEWKEARNAVAELIESANVAVIADRDGYLDDDIVSRLANALARTGAKP